MSLVIDLSVFPRASTASGMDETSIVRLDSMWEIEAPAEPSWDIRRALAWKEKKHNRKTKRVFDIRGFCYLIKHRNLKFFQLIVRKSD